MTDVSERCVMAPRDQEDAAAHDHAGGEEGGPEGIPQASVLSIAASEPTDVCHLHVSKELNSLHPEAHKPGPGHVK